MNKPHKPHKILIVEDNPEIAEGLATIVRSIGDEPTVVHNARDARDVLAKLDPCCTLVDLGLPYEPGAMVLAITGIALIEDILRPHDARRNAEGHRVFVILVISSNDSPRTISQSMEVGADAFIDKPFFEDPSLLVGKIRERLRLAGRESHEACERLAATRSPSTMPPPAPEDWSKILLVIRGHAVNTRVEVLVNGRSAWLPFSELRALLYLVVGRLRGGEGWMKKTEFGTKDGAAVVRALSRLRKSLELPEGVKLEETEAGRGHRLCLNVEVGEVACEGLAGIEGQGVIGKLAGEIRRRGGKGDDA